MSSYIIYYGEANIVCIIIFAIMLFRGLVNVDRQEKQIKYDQALMAFMLYFVCDTLWAGIIDGVLPKTLFTVLSATFGNYICMAGITYKWLLYVMAVEHVPNRDTRRTRSRMLFPFYIATAVLVATWFIRPDLLLDENYTLQPLYSVFQLTVPFIYIGAILAYTMKKAIREKSPIERKVHLGIGLFPLTVCAGGLLQVLVLPETPVFCFSSTILMLLLYINNMEDKISTDPLTGLNNRGQLLHYSLQRSNLYREGRMSFVIMLDINDFKSINDTYGHAEGDRALLIVADALRSAVRRQSMPVFLARYGGDEFIVIAHPTEVAEVDALIAEIHKQITVACQAAGTPYTITTGAGYSQLQGGEDTFHACQQRADENLYLDKAAHKSNRR